MNFSNVDLEGLIYFGCPPSLLALKFFLPLLLGCSYALREGFDGDFPFRVECSEVSYSLCSVWMCVSTCFHLVQEEASLMIAEQGTNL